VQPHSGAQANQAVMFALAAPGDTVLGMSLAAGGHLTHGAAPNQSGKWFRAVQYGVDRATGLIDYAEVERLALEARPRVIIAGGSAYSRVIDFAAFREVLAAPPQLLNPKPSTTQPHHQHSVPPRSTFSQNRESALFGGVAEV
jgi:glycine hydroxymethyltransferase